MNEAVAGSRSPAKETGGCEPATALSDGLSYCEASAAVGGVRAARIAG